MKIEKQRIAQLPCGLEITITFDDTGFRCDFSEPPPYSDERTQEVLDHWLEWLEESIEEFLEGQLFEWSR